MAVVTVLFVLLLLLVVGIAFLSAARSDRVSGQAAAVRNTSDAAVRDTVDYIGRYIADDWLAFANEQQKATPDAVELQRFFSDAPDGGNKWLAGNNGTRDKDRRTFGKVRPEWDRLPQISPFGDGFVLKSNPVGDLLPPTHPKYRPLDTNNNRDMTVPAEASTPRGIPLPVEKVDNDPPPEAQERLAIADQWDRASQIDTDPTGGGTIPRVYDSKYVRLPIPNYEGLTWIAAIRVVDAGGMINVNTAMQVTNPPPPAATPLNPNPSAPPPAPPVLGLTPADIDLYGYLAKVGKFTGGPANWRLELHTAWYYPETGSLAARGWDPTTFATQNPGARLQAWQQLGSVLNERWPSFNSVATAIRPFGPADEWNIRVGQAEKPSAFRLGVDRVAYTVTGVQPSILDGFPPIDKPSRYLTAYNSERMVEVPSGHDPDDSTAARWRPHMQPWLDSLDTVVGVKALAAASPPSAGKNSIPYFQLNPNVSSGPVIADALRVLFAEQGVQYDAPPASVTPTPAELAEAQARSRRAAAALAANLVAYRDVGGYSSSKSVAEYDASATATAVRRHYGLELQPFFAEVVTLQGGSGKAFVVELRNPWKLGGQSIQLSQFKLRVDGVQVDLAGTLEPDGAVLVYTENDLALADWVNSVVARQNNPNITALPVAQVDYADGGGLFELVADTSIVVDRIRPATTEVASWPAPAAEARTLQRDARENTFFPARARPGVTPTVYDPARGGGAPNFIYESLSHQKVFTPKAPLLAPYTDAMLSEEMGEKDKQAKLAVMPAPVQLPVKNRPFDTVGEIGLMFTVCHTQNLTTTEVETFSELLDSRLQERIGQAGAPTKPADPPLGPDGNPVNAGNTAAWQRYSDFMSLVGRLRIYEYLRPSAPEIPVALSVFDLFDILGYQTNRPQLHGRINIATAPGRVLEALPYMSDFVAIRSPGLGMAAYRDRDYAGSPSADIYDFFTNRHDQTGIPFPPVAPVLRAEMGFKSIAEPLLVRGRLGKELEWDFRLNTAASDLIDTNGFYGLNPDPKSQNQHVSGPFDPTPDNAVDDVEERMALYSAMSNLVTLRSDTFVAYVNLYGMKQASSDSPWQQAVVRRFIVLYDRSNVTSNGDRPRILAFAERS